jgi:hypothetical protein
MGDMKDKVARRLIEEFGVPTRNVVKVKSWDISNNIGVVLQLDQPNREDAAYVWLPYPAEGQSVPEIALEYPGEVGRHSGTYPAAGLKRGEPAIRLTIRNATELDEVINYIRATAAHGLVPIVKGSRDPQRQPYPALSNEVSGLAATELIDPTTMPPAEPTKAKREAIPRSVQREVWQRDGGRCVECQTRERLCFDHIVPFSKGGSNSVRNIQLLCENCNLSKNNQI